MSPGPHDRVEHDDLATVDAERAAQVVEEAQRQAEEEAARQAEAQGQAEGLLRVWVAGMTDIPTPNIDAIARAWSWMVGLAMSRPR